jgi:hypothetical protein
VIVAAETADHIVQRSKNTNATRAEFGGVARVVRRQLSEHVRQLQQETAVMQNLQLG